MKTGRAILARPIIKEGGMNMDKDNLKAPVETEEKKPAEPPHQLKDNVRVCGKWRKKGYKPTKDEWDAWVIKCKNTDRDPKTGKRIEKKKAPDKK